MNNRLNLPDVHSALRAFSEVMRVGKNDLPALCEIGSALLKFNRGTESKRCYKAAVEFLQKAARAGDVDLALDCELVIYDAFVKAVEDEQHYFRCFSDWREDMARLGRRFRLPVAGPANPDKVAFVLLTGYVLGHTEVLLRLLEEYAAKPEATKPVVYVVAEWEEAFLERAGAAA